MFISSKFFILLIYIMLFILLTIPYSLCGAANKLESNVLHYASFREISELNPLISTDAASQTVTDLIYQGLVSFSENLELQACLAESWEISNNNRTFIFKLKNNVKWHDNKPLTSRDVVYSINTARSPKRMSIFYNDMKMIKKIIATGPYSLVIEFKKAFAPAFSCLTMPIIPYHKNFDSLSKIPVGTGPFKFYKNNSLQQNSSFETDITLKKNNLYWDKNVTGNVDGFVFHSSRSQKMILPLLLSGTVDAMEIDFSQFTSLCKNQFFKKNFKILKNRMHNYSFLAFNLKKEPFSDPNFRKGIAHAINRKEIIKQVLKGNGEISTGPFPYHSWANDRSIKPIEYNPEKAVQLFKKCNFKQDLKSSTPALTYKSNPFSITILTNKGEAAREKTAEMIAENLRDIGMNTNVLAVSWKKLIQEHVGKRNFDALVLGWSLDPDPDCYSMWHSSETAPGKLNFSGYSNPKVDKLIYQARTLFNKKKRQKKYYKIHKIFHEEQPAVFLYCPMSLMAINKKFVETPVSPLNFFKFLNAWKIKDH